MATTDDVLKVAKLARIHVQSSELEVLQKKFSAILDHFKFLAEVNTDGVEPLFHGIDKMRLRPDVAEAPIPRDELLKNAPDAFESCFRIPKVVGLVE